MFPLYHPTPRHLQGDGCFWTPTSYSLLPFVVYSVPPTLFYNGDIGGDHARFTIQPGNIPREDQASSLPLEEQSLCPARLLEQIPISIVLCPGRVFLSVWVWGHHSLPVPGPGQYFYTGLDRPYWEMGQIYLLALLQSVQPRLKRDQGGTTSCRSSFCTGVV